MTDDKIRAALMALAEADVPGSSTSAAELLRRASVRRRLERAARGSPALEKGVPVTLAAVCAVALIFITPVIFASGSAAISAMVWIALAIFAMSAGAAGHCILTDPTPRSMASLIRE